MRFAILGDLHFKKCKDIEQKYRLKVLSFVRNCLKEKQVENIVQLGDVFHERKSLDINLIKETKDLLQKYFDFKNTFILGNHDVYFRNTNLVNSLELLSNNIVQVPFEYSENSLLLPWITEENYDNIMESLKSDKKKYCFGHFEINGFQLMKGIFSEGKLETSLFKNFKTVFSGHYHLPQEKGNIIYVGSLFQNDFGDEGIEKRFFILDDETDEIEEIKIPYLLFKKIEIKEENDLDCINLENLSEKIVKFIFYIPTSLKREKFIDKAVEILPDCNIIDNSRITETQSLEIANEDFVNIFSEYMEQTNEYDNKRKDDLKKLFLETYKSVCL